MAEWYWLVGGSSAGYLLGWLLGLAGCLAWLAAWLGWLLGWLLGRLTEAGVVETGAPLPRPNCVGADSIVSARMGPHSSSKKTRHTTHPPAPSPPRARTRHRVDLSVVLVVVDSVDSARQIFDKVVASPAPPKGGQVLLKQRWGEAGRG
eukprot:366455-Chlamydomonas_euryale.AAC.8